MLQDLSKRVIAHLSPAPGAASERVPLRRGMAILAGTACAFLLLMATSHVRAQMSLPPCPDPGMCFVNQQAKDDWAASQGCAFEEPAGDRCTAEWRFDDAFLEQSEGALVLEGYVPRRSDGTVIGQSGVTISTGVDLGQQDAAGTRRILNNYINEYGNTGNVDVDALMATLDPYFGKKKQAAVDELEANPLTVTQEEAELLAEAFKYEFKNLVARTFNNRNELGMEFKRLPEAVQTVILDFSYQYYIGTSGNIRSTFWGYVNKGQWLELADWLKSNPDPYTSRRRREGELLQEAIDNYELPSSGDPCPGDATGDGDQD